MLFARLRALPATTITTRSLEQIMNATTKGGAVKLPLDGELRAAVEVARKRRRTTVTGFVREALLQALKAEGQLNEGGR